MHEQDANEIAVQVADALRGDQWGGLDEDYRFEPSRHVTSYGDRVELYVNGECHVWNIVPNVKTYNVTISFDVEARLGKDEGDVEDWASTFAAPWDEDGILMQGRPDVDVSEVTS